ncbi:shikimate kinase [Alkalibaculum sporogenes]|nr:shikimate kinase [Alkalibaculum sporogenes]
MNDTEHISQKIQLGETFSYNIMIIGFMGTGKSTIAKCLSEILSMEEVEMDQHIAEKEGMSINQIFEESGEEYFRNCESNTLIEFNSKKGLIISCGGGVVLREENISHMKNQGKIILLSATPETIYERVKDNTERPILRNNMNIEFIANLLEQRIDRYIEAADIIINTDNKTIEEITDEILRKLSNMI